MIYLTELILFCNTYIVPICIALTCTYVLYVACNIIISPYARHNEDIRCSIARLRVAVTTGKFALFLSSIPLAYRAQWHCYTTARNTPAVSMFTPVVINNTRYVRTLLVLSTFLALGAVRVYVYDTANVIALYVASVYFALLTPMSVLIQTVRRYQYKVACVKFGAYVSLIQAYYGSGDVNMVCPANKNDIDNLVEQIELISRCDQREQADKVANILRNQPSHVERTVSQQRRVNHALNQLFVATGQ